MDKRTSLSVTPEELVEVGLHVVGSVLREVELIVRDDPDSALEPQWGGRHRKKALRIDLRAEDSFVKFLHQYRKKRFAGITVYGEERLRNPRLDLSSREGIFALVDAIDGTDLLERGLSNWCSAAIFFKPSNPIGNRILGAFVGLPSGEIYYATSNGDGAWVQRDGDRVKVSGHSRTRSLKNASVCFYGQKAPNFIGPRTGALVRKVTTFPKSEFRIYNLAGIPMMARLIDHRVRAARGIDAVFDAEGQKPHDVVAGAYIAKKGGAFLADLGGRPIDFDGLEQSLMKPAASESELRYVLASTKVLCHEICCQLRTNPRS